MSINPGHLGASLGAVELAVGIHSIFNTPEDKLIWDVGHQSYAHKILTGRNKDFDQIRQFKGNSGFPKMTESKFDDFGTGHSSTSISAILGMAIADQLNQKKNLHIAVIGDGSLTGGMAFEALNHLATTSANVMVVVNDNDMSIDANVGGLQQHFNNIDPTNNIFTNLGLKYFGPFEGNNIEEVCAQFTLQKEVFGPRIVHFKTKKGYGYEHAAIGNATHWHAPGKFEIETGQGTSGESGFPKTYQHIVGNVLCELGAKHKEVVVITPAMASGSKLKAFEELYPDRFFDVGIAEQHAVTFSAGLATQGKLPFCVIYSTFLQRGYDQLIHDVALQNLKVVFLIDRAGLVGNDGATHHGVFDLAFLNCVPNLTIYTPCDEGELYRLIQALPNKINGPIAIRYPRGKGVNLDAPFLNKDFTSLENIQPSGEILILSIGTITNATKHAIDLLNQEINPIAHIGLQQVKPLPKAELLAFFKGKSHVFIVEDGCKSGGIGESIISWSSEENLESKFHLLAIPDIFIEHGSQEELYESIGMSPTAIAEWVKNII
jgi:1-deoxy-D-xylulose-5-phosphate synthase